MEDLFGFQNMDVSMELDSLEYGLDFDEVNILEGLPSPPHSNNLHFGEVASHLPHEQEQPGGGEVQSSVTHSAATLPTNNNPDVELAEAVAGDWEALINGSITVSDAFAAIPVPQVHVDPATDVSPPTQPHPMLTRPPNLPLTLEEWFSRGISSFLQARPNQPHPLSSQHENMHMPQDMLISKEHDTNNQIMLGKNIASSSCGINQEQNPSQPSSMQKNLEEWFSRGISSFLQAAPNQPHLLSPTQQENMHIRPQDTNHQNMLGKNIAAQNASSWGIYQQQLPSQPSSIQRNPTGRGLGITGTGTLNQGQLLSNQHNQTMLNSTWTGYLLSPLPNVDDLRCAPNSLSFNTHAIHRPQQFSPLTAQGHVPTRHIFDLLKTMQPPGTTYSSSYSRPESGSIYRSTSAPVPPNTSDRQPVQKLMLPEPAVSVRPSLLSPYYHPQPASSSSSLFLNSFGGIPTVPQRYPDIRDYERSYLQSQRMLSHGSAHQALGLTPPSGSPPVADNSNELNQLWSRLNVQGSSPFQGPPILPKVSVSTMVEPSQTLSIAPDASNPSSLLDFKTPVLPKPSWILNSSGSQLQNLAPASTDILIANPNSEDVVTPSSSTRPPLSNRVRRILELGSTPNSPKTKATSSSSRKAGSSHNSASRTNSQPIQIRDLQDPVDKWMQEMETELNKSWNPSKATKKKTASRSVPGPAGEQEAGESSSTKRRKRNSTKKEKEDSSPVPDAAANASENEMDVFQDPNAPEFSGQREADNTTYDVNYQDVAASRDPHVRFYRT